MQEIIILVKACYRAKIRLKKLDARINWQNAFQLSKNQNKNVTIFSDFVRLLCLFVCLIVEKNQ